MFYVLFETKFNNGIDFIKKKEILMLYDIKILILYNSYRKIKIRDRNF